MNAHQAIPTETIKSLENSDFARLKTLSFQERGELLAAACRTAADIETSRRRMGMPPVPPARWPDSTWKFLTENARRVSRE